MNHKKISVILTSMGCLVLLSVIGSWAFSQHNKVQPASANSVPVAENTVSPTQDNVNASQPLVTAESDAFMKTPSLSADNIQSTVIQKDETLYIENVSTQKAAVKKAPVVKATRADVSIRPYKVYLSPSCQTWNPYCDGSGSEELHMRQIASAMPTYLAQYGIQSVLAAPQAGTQANQRQTIVNRVKQATDAKCDLYLAIHSNARDDGPKTYGTSIYYPSTNAQSKRFAQLMAGNFMYPDKSAISINTNDALWEMGMPKMPHCLIETAYHDNALDVQWIEGNTEEIAKNLARCIALNAYVPVSVSMDKATTGIKTGNTCNLTAKVTLINHNTNSNLTTWSSSNSKVAMVKNGTVLAVAPGKAVITASTSNHLSTKCNISVSK